MTWRRTSSNVAVSGASCRVEPSPTARALRLEALRADSPGALSSLLDALPEPPPWDAAVVSDDPAAGLLRGAGFEVYAETATMARRLAGMKEAPHVTEVRVATYRNEWSPEFLSAEEAAMGEDPFYREMGGETGFDTAAGTGAFVVALHGEKIVGFAQAAVPEGWLNWMGVIPDERRKGIGKVLLGEIARQVAADRGTHLVVDAPTTGGAMAFLRNAGFQERGRTLHLIRRG
jgi:GNAT superfamily N-acetyltransferase